jgi:hypothetical protein
MKSYKIKFSAVFFMAMMAMMIAPLVGADLLGTVSLFSVLVAASFIPMPNGVAMMAVTREIWTKDIVDNLYKNNDWAARAFNADMYVLMGKVVHIPVAGAASAVNKNVTSFPVNAVKRTDTDITYNIDTFYTTPRHIEKIEKYELEYDKRQSVLGEDQAALIQSAMNNLLYLWGPAVANVVLTSGASTPATLSGATGNRKKFDKAELSTIKKNMDKNDVPAMGRVVVFTADHYNDFLNSLTDAERTDVGRVADLKTGKVGQYLGFDIYMRSTVLRYRGLDAAVTKVDEQDGAYAADADDRAATLVYQESCVERAKGDVDIFDEPRKAEYYGDIVSMTLRLGGRIRRTSGVWAVVEAIV